MNQKAKSRARIIYNKIHEYIRKKDVSGILTIRINIHCGGITKAESSFQENIEFKDVL